MPPHFSLSPLYSELYQYSSEPSPHFHKKLISVETPLSIDISEQNEDFIIMSENYFTVFNINGTLLGTYQRNKQESRFSCVTIANVYYSLSK